MLRRKIVTLLGLLGLLVAANAGASVVLEFADTFVGSEAVVTSFRIPANEPLVTAKLTDFEFAEEFESISFSITTSTELLGSLLGPGIITFHAKHPEMTYFAHVAGVPAGSLDRGSFGLLVTTAVPIPAAVWLFFSGIVVLKLLGKRRAGSGIVNRL